ncbi:MAG: PQQ-binding-like beta-propeller repeat protein [Bacteroidales bacterium]|nr:PQQ-binding-like beta-propeller repeat protein [Bacteroidales bacterium]MCB8999659.1 PQQ-binding-like beta-propeller repeat protein [Bacteroidales bacterium]MCB9012760.1 PQQ-binding-like beta-propeller repeat protein [Bacteroidales bacterium]
MKISRYHIILYSIILSALLSLGWWLGKDPVRDFKTSEPGLDNRGAAVKVNYNINIGEFFEQLNNESTDLQETWPRFRGEYFDNISRSPVKLIEKFGPSGPKVMWTAKLGEGHAGPAIYKGRVYLLDYDEELHSDMLRCFSLVSGKELWRRWYKVAVKRNHGMSRTVPAVNENYIVTIGPRSHVMCVNREDGKFLWGLNVEKDYNTEVPFWYTGQCPLVENDKLILATGGKALMIAVDCKTGKVLWETPNPDGWGMSHSSIMPYEFKGVRMYVYSAIGGVVGVAADGPNEGQVLWKSSRWNQQVVAPSALCLPDGKIFLTAGYGAGAMILKLSKADTTYRLDVLQEYKPVDGLASEQQTPLVYKSHIIGIMPKDAGALRNQMVCVDPSDFTKMIWTSGQAARFGLGPYMIADNKLFILSDDGTLTIARPSITNYTEIDHARVIEGQDAWGPLAIADGYLLMRDSKTLVCLDMAEGRKLK